jgi:hypothetical protein
LDWSDRQAVGANQVITDGSNFRFNPQYEEMERFAHAVNYAERVLTAAQIPTL